MFRFVSHVDVRTDGPECPSGSEEEGEEDEDEEEGEEEDEEEEEEEIEEEEEGVFVCGSSGSQVPRSVV